MDSGAGANPREIALRLQGNSVGEMPDSRQLESRSEMQGPVQLKKETPYYWDDTRGEASECFSFEEPAPPKDERKPREVQ